MNAPVFRHGGFCQEGYKMAEKTQTAPGEVERDNFERDNDAVKLSNEQVEMTYLGGIKVKTSAKNVDRLAKRGFTRVDAPKPKGRAAVAKADPKAKTAANEE